MERCAHAKSIWGRWRGSGRVTSWRESFRVDLDQLLPRLTSNHGRRVLATLRARRGPQRRGRPKRRPLRRDLTQHSAAEANGDYRELHKSPSQRKPKTTYGTAWLVSSPVR